MPSPNRRVRGMMANTTAVSGTNNGLKNRPLTSCALRPPPPSSRETSGGAATSNSPVPKPAQSWPLLGDGDSSDSNSGGSFISTKLEQDSVHPQTPHTPTRTSTTNPQPTSAPSPNIRLLRKKVNIAATTAAGPIVIIDSNPIPNGQSWLRCEFVKSETKTIVQGNVIKPKPTCAENFGARMMRRKEANRSLGRIGCSGSFIDG